jgi:hypothetical protein
LGTSSHDFWAGGSGGVVINFSAGGSPQDRSVTDITTGYVYDIWGSAPDDYYAVVDGGILHWDGFAWSILPLDGYWAASVHGVSSNEVYFVVNEAIMAMPPATSGTGHSARGGRDPALAPGVAAQPPPQGGVLMWNGSEFIDLDITPDGSTWLYDIWALDANHIFFSAGPYGKVAYYNGSALSTYDLNRHVGLGRIWCDAVTGAAFLPGSMGTVIRAEAD